MGMMENNVQDLDFSVLHRKKFRIDGDDSKVIELDVSDFSVLSRLEESYGKLNEMQKEAAKLYDLGKEMSEREEDEEFSGELEAPEELKALNAQLKKVDQDMRSWVNFVFDYDVCSVISPEGTMYDVIGGNYRYEIIIDKLIAVYEENIKAETKKMNSRLTKYTKDHKRKQKA